MKPRQKVIWGWIALAAIVAGCDGGGGPAPSPIDPFGTEPVGIWGSEPTGRDNEAPPTGGGGSIEALCAQACSHIEAQCPGATSGADCGVGCANFAGRNCDTELRAYLACLGTVNLTCVDGQASTEACTTTQVALAACLEAAGT